MSAFPLYDLLFNTLSQYHSITPEYVWLVTRRLNYLLRESPIRGRTARTTDGDL